MKGYYLLLVPLFLIMVFTGCRGFGFGCHGYGVRGSGNTKDETRNLSDFKEIEIGGAFDVEVICGEKPSIQLTGDDNILPLIKTEVDGSTLHIYTNKNINPRRKLHLRIATESLERLDESGACDINVSGINTESFVVNVSGASKLNLSGKTGHFRMDLSGAGKVSAKDLVCEVADVEISGAAKAEVFASENLRAEISGVGNLDYYGNPKNISKSISGVGSITQR